MVHIRYQMTRTPSLTNPIVQTKTPGTQFTAPLHGILTGHGPALRYIYVCSPRISAKFTIIASTLPLRQDPDH